MKTRPRKHSDENIRVAVHSPNRETGGNTCNEPKTYVHAIMSSRFLVTGVVLFYLLVALAMVVANKWVLNATPTTPLFFLWSQLFLATAFFIIAAILRILPGSVDLSKTSIATSKGLLPLISFNTLSLVSTTVTLQYVDASFYQVARGLLLPFTVLTSLGFLNSKPSSSILFSCFIVTLGFFIGVLLDGTPISIKGVWWGVLSSLLTSVHSVMIKRSLVVPGVDGSAIMLGWYSNLGSSVMLLPIIFLVGEAPGVLHLIFGEQQGSSSPLVTFMWGSLITGTLGFLMCISSLLSIKITSPITHMVSSAVRGVAGSLLGVWVFGDIFTSGRATSIATILLGSIMYTWFKHKEQERADVREQNSSPPSESNGHEYQKVDRDEHGDDIEMGAREKS